jgi:hypothetical protein
MTSDTKNVFDVFFSFAQLLAIIVGAVWAYLRFWREGQHAQRIEFDITCDFSQPQNGSRIAAFSLHAHNRGNVEQRFSRISLRVLGLTSSDPLTLREDFRLSFPHSVTKAEVIPEKVGYYFVRPGVNQRFAFTTTIPEEISFVLARAAFKYQR